jgi:hypothetical protein
MGDAMHGRLFGLLRPPAAVSVLALLAAMTAACALPLNASRTSPSPSPSPNAAPPPLGDACLVGRWIDRRSVDATDWTFNGQVVPVTGLAGFVLTLSADGEETDDWSNSEPLIGTYQGQQLKIVLRGFYTFHGVTANGVELTEPPGEGSFSAQFFLGGRTQSTYSAHAGTGSTESYVCSATSLSVTTQGSQVTSDSYVRA